MAPIIGGRVRSLQWLADPPKFFEVKLDEHGDYVLDQYGAYVRTGRVVKGMNARKLMEELQRVRRYEKNALGEDVEVRGVLPKQWVLDIAHEHGLTYLTDWTGMPVKDRRGNKIPLPKGQRGTIKGGRRHTIPFASERAVRVSDSIDLKFVTWWKERYPDIPYRPLTQDYYWYNTSADNVTDVWYEDAEIILLGCVGEFLDVTNGGHESVLPSPAEPILLVS